MAAATPVFFVTFYSGTFNILSFDTASTPHAAAIMALIDEARRWDDDTEEKTWFAVSKLLLWLHSASKPEKQRDCWHADRQANVPMEIPKELRNAVHTDFGHWKEHDKIVAGKLSYPVYLYNNGFRPWN